MKRKALTIVFACCTLAMMAQDAIKVNYKGAKPTISDFAWALFAAIDEDEEESGDRPAYAIREAMIKQRNGLPQEEGVTLTVDEKNGYILYEWLQGSYVIRMEMCYWNESDGKHKLFAFNNLASYDTADGSPLATETSDISFFRYNNATKRMIYCDPPGFVVDYSATYALPRTGKDITVTKWNKDGTTTKKKLKWNGRRFTK